MKKIFLLLTLSLTAAHAQSNFQEAQKTGVVLGQNGWLFHIAEFGDFQQETPDVSQQKLETIGVISNLFKQKGIPVVTALVPGKIRLYEKELPAQFALPPVVKNRYERNLSSLQGLGVNVPDLLKAMQEGQKDPLEAKYPVYQKLDHHWSSRGALIAAKTITDVLKNLPEVQSVPETKFDLKAAPESDYFDSSLLKRVAEQDSQKYPKEKFIPYDLVKTSSANSLLGDSAPELVLVGSSASAGGRMWPFDYGLAANLQKEFLNTAQAGRGPWLPMEDYLRNPAYQQNPPKAMVWQLWEAFLLNVDQADLPQDWIRTVAPLILGKCEKPKQALAAAAQAQYPADQSITDYWNATINLSGSNRVKVTFQSPQGPQTLEVPVPVEGENYDLNVPVPAHSTGVSVEPVSTGATLQVQNSQLCNGPAEVAQLLVPAQNKVDVAKNGRISRVDISGFSGVEGGARRWALGPKSGVSFWQADSKPAVLTVDLYNPLNDQDLTVLFNNQPIKSFTGLKAGSTLSFTLELPGTIGKNALEFQVKKFNGQPEFFAQQDTRKMSVMFNRLEVQFR